MHVIMIYMGWGIVYYSERVREAVLALPAGMLADYRRLLDLLQTHGAVLRMPHSRPMGGGLFELRPKGKEGIARVFYCTAIGSTIVVLHSFVKKTDETPVDDIKIARRRLKEVSNAQKKI